MPHEPGELSHDERERFDRLLEDVIESLPANLRELIDQVPVVVLDCPTPEMVRSLKREGTLDPDDDGRDLCGLHTGVAITDRSIEDPGGWGAVGGGSTMAVSDSGDDHAAWLREGGAATGGGGGEAGEGGGGGGPEQIHLFRIGVIDLAGGWEQPRADEEVYEEIRITLLHEIGHHFGLDEDDLDELGYA